MSTYLESMKLQNLKRTDLALKKTKEGKEEFKEDDLDAATRLFAEKGEV